LNPAESVVHLRRKSKPPEIWNNNSLVGQQLGREGRPHVTDLAAAMNQNHRRTGSADANMERGVIGLCLDDADLLAEWRNPGQKRLREEAERCGYHEQI
jgi:hypothetical protein